MECFILAGGQSRRFGRDKLTYPLARRTIIERVTEAASKVFRSVYIVTKDPERFSSLPFPKLRDVYEIQAPMVGILTAIRNASGDLLAVLGGDMPMINREVLLLLKERATRPAVVFRLGDKVHPLVGIYSKELEGLMEDMVRNGRLSLTEMLSEAGAYYIEEEEVRKVDPELLSFVNINTKEDLRAVAEKMV